MPVSTMPSCFQSYKPRYMKVYGAICINNKGEVLLVHGRQSKKWSFPKGHVKGNEKDLECVKRELYEETGLLAPDNYVSFHKLYAASYYIFVYENTPKTKINDKSEVDELMWVPLTQIPEEDCNVDVSIFRSIMKSIRYDQDEIEYISSDFAHKKATHIKSQIEKNETKVIC